jgi:glycosyltransferase involved in cell wall biosynthesis
MQRSYEDDDQDLRKKWGIPENAPVVGTVARLVPLKALDVLLESAALILQRIPEVRFVIVGRGVEMEKLQALSAKLKIDKHVILTGRQLDIHRYYQMFDIFALSSLTEGCSNVLIEAMDFALPIVATRVGGNPELLEDGRSALLVEPRAAQPLADAIERLLTDKELANRLAQNAKIDVDKNTVESYVKNMQNYYLNLFEQKIGVNK